MKEIVQKDVSVLRDVAKDVPVDKIETPEIQNLLSEMREALAGETDGVALAAPQIGNSVRIFIVSEKVFEDKNTKHEHTVFINPKITKTSKDLESMHEGCLSVRGWYGKVNRHVKATIEAYDQNSKLFTLGASGLLAQIFQHEIDHLNGVLFIDKASELQELKEDEE